ncbi:MAG: MOSC domain-containing protein [Gammaproteobacteria bacterium]|nr:MOSC domain-containing protein [Gammaproteobacteria bacterium]
MPRDSHDLFRVMQLTQINIYPIKSTAGIKLEHSQVLPRGLEHDRRWMLVDHEWRFITARECPTLVLVTTTLRPEGLVVSGPNASTVTIPHKANGHGHCEVEVWGDVCSGVKVSDAADSWFSAYLGRPCHLVHMTDSSIRRVDPNYSRAGDIVSFADGFPLLLISTLSLHDLNTHLSQPVSMQRFRPNLVVDGCDAYAEDNWRRLRIGEVEFEGAKACSRCVLTTVDPDSGERHPELEPLRTLGTYRRGPEGGVFFGQNLIPRGQGVVHVGDDVEILD